VKRGVCRVVMAWLMLPAMVAAAGQDRSAAVTLPGEVGGAYRVPVKSMKQLVNERLFRTTVRQSLDFSCGSAAVATLLTHHYDAPTTEDHALYFMYQRGDREKIKQEGFSMLDMKEYLEARGYRADGFEIGPDQFDQLVRESLPFIALMEENGYNHFVVVKGAHGDHVLLGDPSRGTRTLKRTLFDRLWANRLAFMIHSHKRVAKFNIREHWRIVPVFLGEGVPRESLAAVTLMRRGPNDL